MAPGDLRSVGDSAADGSSVARRALARCGSHPDRVKEGIYAWMYGSYEKGKTLRHPEDLGFLCPWLVDSLSGFQRALENGAKLSIRDCGAPYEKEIDPDGVTTECVRGLDPTACGVVVKIRRTALP